MNKIKILDTININTSFLYTSFDKAAKLLLEKKEELEKDGWSSIHLDMEQSYDYCELVAKGMRLETDKELEERKKKEEAKIKRIEKKLERDRKKYEELKEKFEK